MKPAPVWQISVVTTGEAEEVVGALLGDIFAALPSSYMDAATNHTTVAVFLEKLPTGLATMRTEVKQGLERIRACGIEVGTGRIAVRRIEAQNWAESWKRHFKPIEIGRALLVKPSWSRRVAKQGQATVVLDPGLSFGTGQHPTTRFCLQQLVAHRQSGRMQSVLDVGTGSGILAIAAAKLGYEPVLGIDFDPDAVRVALLNARVNQMADKINLSRVDLTRLEKWNARKFDLVCANLLADLLISQRTKLVARLRPGGVLVIAGILKQEFLEVRRVYEKAGLKLQTGAVEKEWKSGSFLRAH